MKSQEAENLWKICKSILQIYEMRKKYFEERIRLLEGIGPWESISEEQQRVIKQKLGRFLRAEIRVLDIARKMDDSGASNIDIARRELNNVPENIGFCGINFKKRELKRALEYVKAAFQILEKETEIIEARMRVEEAFLEKPDSKSFDNYLKQMRKEEESFNRTKNEIACVITANRSILEKIKGAMKYLKIPSLAAFFYSSAPMFAAATNVLVEKEPISQDNSGWGNIPPIMILPILMVALLGLAYLKTVLDEIAYKK